MAIEDILNSVPTPSADELSAAIGRAKHYTLVFLRKGPAPRDDKTRNEQLQREHLQHLHKLQTLGLLMLNGPVMAEHEMLGVSIYAVGLDEARALAEADPKVKAGYLAVEAIPWMAVSAPAQ